jgi:hypothetical protein
MTRHCRALLLLVAAAALRPDAPAVRFVARRAFGVALVDLSALSGVARVAASRPQLGSMRQPRVTALASLVPRQRFHGRQLTGVAGSAGASIRRFAHEVVGHVAALALCSRVKLALAGGLLVAGTAVTHARSRLRASRVRIVATHARANFTLLGVVGMFVGVTTSAGLVRAVAHVMCGVAARAFSMPRCVTGAEHGQVFVTGPAGDGLVFTELMRLVAADAGHVPPFEQRRRRDQRLGLGVTRHTAGKRFCSGGMLLLVAGRAHLIGSLAFDGVRGLHVFVAACAGPGLRCRVLVRPVAVQALPAVVNLHSGRQSLALTVAMSAVARGVVVKLLVLRQALERAHVGVVAEPVTKRAIGPELGFESGARLPRSVGDARFLFVARGAAQR